MMSFVRPTTQIRVNQREQELVNAKLGADVAALDNILTDDYNYFELDKMQLLKEDELLIAESKVVVFKNIKIIDFRLWPLLGSTYRTSLLLEFYGVFAGKRFAKLRDLNHSWIEVNGILKLKFAYSTGIGIDIEQP
jgi:hypothetical protein